MLLFILINLVLATKFSINQQNLNLGEEKKLPDKILMIKSNKNEKKNESEKKKKSEEKNESEEHSILYSSICLISNFCCTINQIYDVVKDKKIKKLIRDLNNSIKKEKSHNLNNELKEKRNNLSNAFLDEKGIKKLINLMNLCVELFNLKFYKFNNKVKNQLKKFYHSIEGNAYNMENYKINYLKQIAIYLCEWNKEYEKIYNVLRPYIYINDVLFISKENQEWKKITFMTDIAKDFCERPILDSLDKSVKILKDIISKKETPKEK